MSHTILIIDDSKLIRDQIREIVVAYGLATQIVEAADGMAGIKAALENSVDLILCDLEMPGLDGFKLLALVNAREELRGVPVIILSGHSKQEDKLRGLQQGASDYITKPFDTAELVARVRVHLKIKDLQDELKESNAQLAALSRTDPLTQLPNRRYLEETLVKETERARRTGQLLGLALLDIDHFKRVNDKYGHPQGDEVLRMVAEIIRSNIRPYDFAARFGGEEFVLLWPQLNSPDDAFRFAERLRVAISQQTFSGALIDLRVTVSLGLAFYPSSGISNVETLIEHADIALYRAKLGGRNCVILAD